MNKDYQLFIVKSQNTIAHALDAFKIGHGDVSFQPGPTVTLFEFEPELGIKASKFLNLKAEFATALKVQAVRMIAPTERGTWAIEVPNRVRQNVEVVDMLYSTEYMNTSMQLPLCIGRKVDNSIFMADLATMPHLLVAGATGMGKSVGLNVILMSLLNKLSPKELKLVLIDPKQVELSIYNTIARPYIARLRHSRNAVITDVEDAKAALASVIQLMESRYTTLSTAGVRNIQEYNRSHPNDKLPYIVVVIDEYSDLIMQTKGREMETSICRIAQKARAVGIHMIISTQRPDAKVVTGNIKANFPTRIAFRTTTGTDSRVILDKVGAERLTGRGDMLYFDGGDFIRCQCAYISTPDLQETLQEMAEEYADVRQSCLPQQPVQRQRTIYDEAPQFLKDLVEKTGLYKYTASRWEAEKKYGYSPYM